MQENITKIQWNGNTTNFRELWTFFVLGWKFPIFAAIIKMKNML